MNKRLTIAIIGSTLVLLAVILFKSGSITHWSVDCLAYVGLFMIGVGIVWDSENKEGKALGGKG